MATKATKTRLLVGTASGAWDFSGVTNSLEVALSGEKIENTRFQDTAKTFTTGDISGSITQSGYFDATGADSLEQEMASITANGTLAYVGCIYGTEESAPIAYIAPSTNVEGIKLSAPIGGLITVSGSWFDGLGIKRGLQVYRGTISGTGPAGSYIDTGAVGSLGGFAWIWITTITGTATNAAVKLQSDDNTSFTSAADEGTFTFSGKKAIEVTLTGDVDRYLRINTTSLGGATSFLVTVVAAVRGVTY